jgi:hypothetical protein
MSIQTCRTCGKTFGAKPSHVAVGHGLYCSRVCHHQGMKRGFEVRCAMCGASVYRSPQDLRRSKSKKFFCTKSCQTKWRNSVYRGEKHAKWKHGKHVDYRSVLRTVGRRERCVLCAVADVRILVVHHVDHNHSNNTSANLVWLCHNCHHEVHYDKVGRQALKAVLVRK